MSGKPFITFCLEHPRFLSIYKDRGKPRAYRYDAELGVLMVWYGGHTVNVYNSDGVEFTVYSVGDFRDNEADPKRIHKFMDYKTKHKAEWRYV